MFLIHPQHFDMTLQSLCAKGFVVVDCISLSVSLSSQAGEISQKERDYTSSTYIELLSDIHRCNIGDQRSSIANLQGLTNIACLLYFVIVIVFVIAFFFRYPTFFVFFFEIPT